VLHVDSDRCEWGKFLLVPAYPGCPGSKAVKRSLVVGTYSGSSVLLWRRSDTFRISGFMNDVIFSHKLRLLDVAARLRQRGSQNVRSLGLGA